MARDVLCLGIIDVPEVGHDGAKMSAAAAAILAATLHASER
jgi:hypothetical protein